MEYLDAHNHLHFPPLQEVEKADYFQQVKMVAVNGTHPRDWQAVADLAEAYPEQVIPLMGVHPWELKELPDGWESHLRRLLQRFPRAGVGEVGLDKWMKDYDLPLQKEVFKRQITVANDLQRVMTVHCLKAWGTLRDILRSSPIKHGFLLHAYSGPAEWINEFSEMGAYFSFSPYFLYERKAERIAAFGKVPRNRLLLETDAPAMLGPRSSWSEAQEGFSNVDQHPENIKAIYSAGAEVLGVSLPELSSLCEENFISLYLA